MCSKTTTVLIVEDNDDILSLWVMLFSDMGMNVLSARTLYEACQAFEVGVTIDVLLVDYMLPDGCGPKLLTLVGDRLPKLRILITGHNITHPGFSECFTKPVDVPKMCKIVLSKLEECHATRT